MEVMSEPRQAGVTPEGGGDLEAGGSAGATQGAAEGARAAVEQAKEKTQAAAGDARERVRQQVDQRSTQVGERVSTTSQDLRGLSDELRKQGKDGPAKIADQVADRAERVGGYLQETDAQRLLHDAEDFGRRQPWVVVAAAAALGFAAARVLKASSEKRYEQGGIGAPARPNGATAGPSAPGGPGMQPGGYQPGGHAPTSAGAPAVQPGGFTPPGR